MPWYYDLAIASHLIGVILWIGGIVAAAMVAASAAKEPAASRGVALMAARRSVLAISTPGMLLAWISGLAVLVPSFTELYARAGWMHGKLTLLIVLSAITGVMSGRLRKAAAGTKDPSAGLFAILALVIVVLMVVVVFLARLKPGA